MAVKKTDNEIETFDVQKFFSRKNEREGVWFEPEVMGSPCGIKFLMLGLDSDEAVKASEIFRKESEEADLIEDAIEKKNRYEEILAKRIAAVTIDIKSANDKKLTIGGKALTKDDIYDVIYNSPVIAVKLMDFHRGQESFLGIKKNN